MSEQTNSEQSVSPRLAAAIDAWERCRAVGLRDRLEHVLQAVDYAATEGGMEGATDLERGDAYGGAWPEGILRFTWSRQTGHVRVYFADHAHQLVAAEAERALDDLTRCVKAVRDWTARGGSRS